MSSLAQQETTLKWTAILESLFNFIFAQVSSHNILRVYSLWFTYDVTFLQVYTLDKISGDMTINFWGDITLVLADMTSGEMTFGNLTGYPQDMLKHFKLLKKWRNKFDCLVYEMLFIRTSDSIRAKVFW